MFIRTKTCRVAVAVGALLMATAACSSEQTESAKATGPGQPASSQPSDLLSAIVIAEASAPTGTEYLQSFDGSFSGTQMIQDASPDVKGSMLEGWVDALTREFASAEAAAVILGEDSPEQLEPADHRFVGSIASAYEDGASARRALDAALPAMSENANATEDLALGEGGVMLRRRFLQVASVSYIWTNDRYLLVLTANGMPGGEILSLAAGMNERVP